jgi:Saxitoxin biosynthesis operon protein SxtJ
MASDRTFGLVMAAACALGGLWPLLHGRPVRWPAMGLCAAFLLPALSRPALLHPLNRGWTVLAGLLNRVTTPLACGLLFYLVITPLAWAMRLSGKDPLRLRPDDAGRTYWIDRQPDGERTRESMRMQF